MKYAIARLTEKSTFFRLVSATCTLTGLNVSDEKTSAAFFIVSLVFAVITAGAKEKGSE
ncbi:hypothetical protein THIOSC15_990007 [uncultured Thiomicrorhabdus sp.]